MRYVLGVLAGCCLLLAAGCGRSDWSGSMYVDGYAYFFVTGTPHDFTGDKAADEELIQMVTGLLQDRTLEPSMLGIGTEPSYQDHSTIKTGAASSKAWHPLLYPPGTLLPGETVNYRGVLQTNGNRICITLDTDAAGNMQPVRIQYLFDHARAQELVDGLKTWRKTTTDDYHISEDTLEADVILRGTEDGENWTLVCKVDLSCVALFRWAC